MEDFTSEDPDGPNEIREAFPPGHLIPISFFPLDSVQGSGNNDSIYSSTFSLSGRGGD